MSVNDRRVRSSAEFADALEAVGIGNQVTLTLLRDGKKTLSKAQYQILVEIQTA